MEFIDVKAVGIPKAVYHILCYNIYTNMLSNYKVSQPVSSTVLFIVQKVGHLGHTQGQHFVSLNFHSLIKRTSIVGKILPRFRLKVLVTHC